MSCTVQTGRSPCWRYQMLVWSIDSVACLCFYFVVTMILQWILQTSTWNLWIVDDSASVIKWSFVPFWFPLLTTGPAKRSNSLDTRMWNRQRSSYWCRNIVMSRKRVSRIPVLTYDCDVIAFVSIQYIVDARQKLCESILRARTHQM